MRLVLTSWGEVCDAPADVVKWYKPIWEDVVR
jgi:hypothetical protein